MKLPVPKAAESHERWLVSYADFITLLFAFFVVMFASSEMNRKKVAQFSQAYGAYLEGGSSAVAELRAEAEALGESEDLGNSSGDSLLDGRELKSLKAEVENMLADLLEDETINLKLEARGLIISLREAALFPAGEAAFLEEAPELFAKLAAALTSVPSRQVRLEGHTDNVPIRSATYPSNWELSSARAIGVLRELVDRHGLDENRIAVSGYGEHRPVDSNETAAGRAANRRVDIVILSNEAEAQEPSGDHEQLP